ncbi:hypothetical protein H7J07_04820 [Mycobacterium koreense]|uniref:Uncharacterized protein n=1 Tax=Mycolicibacillus koreensis TaxID=1069220 RepID=A0A7I7SAX9_9MYCO|nr:hypothetical protein [Mycolicibacillus koreensis]MCV7247580.1 hypothetical protein [Mycolicibacillus koreensis]OSC32841.1 hypothetical protein B8W67_14075 [Mycolicibacillus koreensis]BBY53958.1 hypothetical protein MKOR_12090 [Mycolicibacillus koreensis]
MSANITLETLAREQLVVIGRDYVTGTAARFPWYRWADQYRSVVSLAIRAYSSVYGRRISLRGNAERGAVIVREANGSVVLHVDWDSAFISSG